MTNFIVKVYMMEVETKDFISLRSSLRSSTEDSQNLIVDMEELKASLCDIKSNELQEFLKETIGQVPKEVKYVWFYL